MSEQRLDELFRSHDERNQLLLDLLPKVDDITLITLKGHLLVEEALYSIVVSHCNFPKYIGEARLSFYQLSHLAKALIALPIHDSVFPAIHRLNKLRNELAHNVSSQKEEMLVNELVSLCGNLKATERGLPEQVRGAICYIMGGLSVVGAVSEFIADKSNQ